MPVLENTSQRLVLKSGSTTLSLDRNDGKAKLERKVFLWQRKPLEAALSDVADVVVDKAVDRAAGVEFFSTMLVFRGGQGWALPADDKAQAQEHLAAIRQFVGLAAT